MRCLKIFIIMLILILSVGTVCATDAISDDNATVLETAQDDVVVEVTQDHTSLAEDSSKTFADLRNDIGNSSDIFNVGDDYIFNGEIDGSGVIINKSNFVINGNGHTIDGNHISRIFNINGTNVTVNDLILVNGNNSSIYVSPNSSLTLNNVAFENNYAKFGSAIYLNKSSELKLTNGSFKSDKDLVWGLIYNNGGVLYVENTDFTNIVSNYSSAIFSENGRLRIKNSNFINLTAKVTAGAIGLKCIEDKIIIENCSFINVKSQRNGGAIFVDTTSVSHNNETGNITIADSQFINCSSEFGGAYLQLAGHLNIRNTNFTFNSAVYDGGAIYTSGLNSTSISNSRFISNNALTEGFSNGGAGYFDNGNVILDSCIFENNAASEGLSVYTYDCNLTLSNNFFNNPSDNASSIYTMFEKGYLEKGNNFTGDKKSLNNTDYNYNIEGSQASFVILNNSLSFDTLPERFDLRDYGWVSSVKAQGKMGACWTFGSIGALESSLIRYANITFDFSENNLQNSMLMFSKYGGMGIEGGDVLTALNYFVSWLGVSPMEYDSFDELGKISPLIATENDIHVKDVVLVPLRNELNDTAPLKEALVKYGAIALAYADFSEKDMYFNTTTSGHYFNEAGSNHIICVVGWDDNFPKESFGRLKPPGDGAFILKNSWGPEWGDNGYLYISYYDSSFLTMDVGMGFDLKNNINYKRIYQHDLGGNTESVKYSYLMNKYVAEEDGYIAAVGTLFNDKNVNYEFSILVNDVNVYNQTGISDYFGYSTIKLNKYVPVKCGDEFKVIFRNASYISTNSRVHFQNNVSLASNDGVNWEDLAVNKSAAVLKVYTLSDIADDLEKYYSDDTPFAVKVEPGSDVSFEINGITATVRADENGVAKIGVNLEPGNYTVNVRTYQISSSYVIEVKSTIISQDVVRGYNSDHDFKIQLLKNDGSSLADSKVNITVNDNTQEYLADGNGIVTVKFTDLNKNQIIGIVNPTTGEVAQNTIKIVSRFSGNANVNMYYFDGSSYKFKVYGDDGNLVGKNMVVSIKINKKTYKVKTGENSVVSFKIPNTVKPGTYAITATYAGQTVKNTVKVKQVLKASKLTVKKSAKKFTLKATLKNKLKGKTISFKFNGKTYKAKTNSKGIAKVTVKKNVIQKLKKGKTYAVKVTYSKDTIKSTVKIK